MGRRLLHAALTAALLGWMLVPAGGAAAKVVARGLPDTFLAHVLGSPAERAEAFDALMSVRRLQELVSVPKNLVQFHVFGTVDTPTVVGGADGWLFFRDQFEDGKCPPDPDPLVEAANAAATARAVAELVGVRLLWAVAPDKSVVHPERLGARATALAPCNQRVAYLFRSLLRRLAAEAVDHLEVLAREPDGPQYYWATGTHWNRIGYLRAAWQLRRALDPEAGPLEIAAAGGGTEERETDLSRLVLGSPLTEAGPLAPHEVEEAVLGTPIRGTEGAVVVHDSFLGIYPETAGLFGPGARVMNYNRLTSRQVPTAIDPLPRLLVLSSVERLSVRRMSGEWSIDGPLLRPLKDAYLAASRHACGDAPPLAVAAAPRETAPSGEPAYLVEVAPGATCLNLDLTRPEAEGWRVWWPPLEGQEAGATFEPGRWIALPPGQGPESAPLLLPAGVAGRAVLVEPL